MATTIRTKNVISLMIEEMYKNSIKIPKPHFQVTTKCLHWSNEWPFGPQPNRWNVEALWITPTEAATNRKIFQLDNREVFSFVIMNDSASKSKKKD